MKILEMMIRNFGKLSNRHIELSDGINLIYGENESGKSTVHTFLRAMFFGLERARGRAAANDAYSLYEPWENPNYYSGAVKFESGGKFFLLDRNFDKFSKKAEIFCEDDGEELSVENGDLEMLLGEFSEPVYNNTVSVGQLHAQPGQELSAALRDYATNYYASGGGDLNLDAALLQLRERKKEIERQIKEDFRKKQVKREQVEQEASYIWREIHRLQTEREDLKEKIAYRIEHQPSRGEPENNRVIDELRPGKWRIHPLEIFVFIVAVVLVFMFIRRPWNYLVAIVLALLCLIYTWNRLKVSKKQEKTEPEKILEEIMPEEEKIPLERLYWELEREEEELGEKQVQYSNLREQLEEMDEMGEEFWEQEKMREAVDLAADTINRLSARLQKRMEQKMNDLLSEVIYDLTGGKYSRLVIGEGLRPSLLRDGKKIPVERVSVSTAEQVYLALRMVSAKVFQEEELPVLLDDTFAYYDDIRLKNTLRWLEKNKEQVILFTCQNREEEALKEMGIPYRKITLER